MEACINFSLDNVSAEYSQEQVNLVYAVSYLLYLLVGLPWNVLVMVAIVRQKLYTQPTIILLLNLVLTDSLVLLLVLPYPMVTGFAGEYVFGTSDRIRCHVCKTHLIMEVILKLSLIFSVPLLAFDRFLFIHQPLHYYRWITPKRMLLAVFVSWTLCILCSVFEMLLLKEVQFDPLTLVCTWKTSEHPFFHIFSLLVLLLSYIVLLVCNIWVIVIVLKNIRAVYQVQKPSLSPEERRFSREKVNKHIKQMRSRKQLHMTRVFGGIICTNSLVWLPTTILAIASFRLFNITEEYVILSTLLFFSQVILHPLLEIALIRDIWQPIKNMVMPCRIKRNYSEQKSCCCGNCPSNDMTEETTTSCHDFCNAIWLPHSSFTKTPPNTSKLDHPNGNLATNNDNQV